MPLTVGRIENLFWSNSSYKKPNCAPTLDKAQELDQIPVMYGFMGGRTHLYGDQWNYAIYKGVYYFLKIESCKDLGKQHYTYALIRDLWVNMIMNHNVEVKGYLTTTNRDGWIEANLNRTHPILTQPCNVTRVSLIEEEQALADAAFVESKKTLSLPLFDIREFREFRDRWNIAAKKYKKQIELNKYRAGNSPIFIFAELKGKNVETVHSWKEYLRIKLNEFLRDLGNEGLVISKVQNTEGAGRLKEHYCITWNKGGIGSGVENVVIDLVDLGGLEDIVHINPKTLEEGAPMKVIEEAVFEDIEFSDFQSQEKGFSEELITKKFRRKIYFPITQEPDRVGISLSPHYKHQGYEDNPILKNRLNWQWLSPQHVKLKETGLKELFLFWVDNADFVLNYEEEITYRFELGTMAGSMGGGFVAAEGESWKFTSTDYRGYLEEVFGITEYPKDFKVPYPFYATWGDKYESWFFNHQLITPIGFLIFKPFNRDYLDGYIWRGNKTKKIHYISGLRRSQLEKIESGRAFSEIGKMNELPYPIGDYYAFSGEPTKYNWNRYHFNLLNGLDILLQPNQKGYPYEYRTWRPNDRTSNNYSPRYLQHDQAPWLDNRAPFYNKQRHQESNRRSRKLVDWLVMKTLIEIPVELKSGDYLFNDLEYWLDEHGTELWTDAVSYARVNPLSAPTDPILEKLFALEDYVKKPGAIEDSGNNSVVICSTREGGLEIRQCVRFSKTHRLHSDIYSANLADIRTDIDSLEGFGGSREAQLAALRYSTKDLKENEQAVESVSGHTSTRVGYIALKKMDRGEIEKVDEPLRPEQIKEVIAAFLKSNGYKLSPDNQSFLYFERKDFDEAVDLFFDLKGTDWYLHVKSGRFSLIAKKPDLFRARDLKVSKLKSEDSLKELSVVEKVNQKCVLNVYTHQRLLNTRFNFDNDKLNVSVKALKPTHKMNPTNYYQMNLRGDYDVIEREILSIQKKQLDETATIVDYTQLEALRAQMRRNDRDYDIRMARDVMFATEKENEEYRRKKWDLDAERMRYWLSQGANLATLGLTGLGLPGLPGTIGTVINSIGKLAGNAKKMKISASALGTIRGARGITQTIGNTILQNQILEERGRRIETDRQFAFKEIAFRSLEIDLKHRDKQEDSIRELNKLGNVYSRGTINDIDAIEEFNKENKLGVINLTVFTPSKEQLKVLNDLKEEYGVDCDIPNAVIQLREGMSGDVIRFRHLEDDGVIGVDNAVVREWLMAALEMGIKIVDSCDVMRTRARQEKEYWACANVYQLTKEIENQRILSGNTGAQERELRGEIDQLKEQINSKDQEITQKQQEIEQLKEKAANDKSALDECAKNKAEKESELARLREECEKEKKEKDEELELAHHTCERIKNDLRDKQAALEEEIRRHKVDFEDLTQQLNNERRKALNLQDEVNRTKKDKENLEKRVSDLEKQLADEKAKKPEGKKPKGTPGECELMKSILSDPYSYELKTRGDGWSAFMDLIFELAQALKWKDLSEVDQKLIGAPEIRPTLERLEELKNIPIIDKAMEAIKEKGWKDYLQWIETNGEMGEDVRKVLDKVNQIKMMETMPTVHSVKSLLDELNWLSYQAKFQLREALKTNEDLQFLFAHIYPGKALDLYKEVFGDPNLAIIRKRFSERVKCTADGTDSVIQVLLNYKKNVVHGVSDVQTRPEKIPTDTPKTGEGERPTQEAKPEVDPPRRPTLPVPPAKPFEWKYYGTNIPGLDLGTGKVFENPIQFFEDNYETSDWSANDSLFRGNPGRLAITFWKYPYYKTGSRWKWQEGKNHRVVWFYKKWSDGAGRPQEHYGHYMEAVYYDGLDVFEDIWRRKDELVIPQDMFEAITLGHRKIKIRFAHLETETYEIRKYTETIEWEDGKFEIPEERLLDFVKWVFLLHYFYISPYDAGEADTYKIYGWDGGGLTRFFLEKGRWQHSNNEERIKYLNDKIAAIKDTTIDLDLGWLFNRAPNGDRQLPNGRGYPYLYLLKYFYRLMNQANWRFSHPWNTGKGEIIKMFRKLDQIRRA